MTHAQENSYDKAVNSWNDAKIRYGQAWPYLKKAGEECIYTAVWLLGIFTLTKVLKVNETNDLSKNLPDSTKAIMNLSQDVIKILGDNKVGGVMLTAGLYNYAKDPQDGTKIVEQVGNVLKNLVIGSLNFVQSGCYFAKYVVTKYQVTKYSEYYFAKYDGYPSYTSYTGLYFKCSESEISEDIQSDESSTLNGEEASLQTSE
jgi:hypothetical protein